MSRSCLAGLLACSLLVVAAHHASARSTKSASRYPIIGDTCPVLVSVGKNFDHALVPLEETLEMYLRPNQPKMNVTIIGHEVLYKASVAGTMVKLFACNVWGANCTLLDEGGTKNRDLLVVDEWNRVQFKYVNGEIAVNINTRNNVMGRHMMPMAKGPSKTKNSEDGGIGYLTFVVPPKSDSYRASLKIPCDEYGVPPYIVTAPPSPPAATSTPTSPSPMDSRPYPLCPTYQIEENHSTPTTPGEPVQQSFTFAIYPNLPAVMMDVFSGQHNFKFQLKGSLLELRKCNGMGRDCQLIQRKMETSNIIEAHTWNEVTVYLQDDQIFIKVNNSVIDVNSLESGVHKGLKVVVMAPEATTTTTEYFVAKVNVHCFVMEQHPINPGTAPTTTVGGLPTKDSIVETTPKTDASGVTRDIVIVVGVLVGVLLVIAIAIVISTYRKRRSATINEHSPLQNQHQQQDH